MSLKECLDLLGEVLCTMNNSGNTCLPPTAPLTTHLSQHLYQSRAPGTSLQLTTLMKTVGTGVRLVIRSKILRLEWNVKEDIKTWNFIPVISLKNLNTEIGGFILKASIITMVMLDYRLCFPHQNRIADHSVLGDH